jgi:hypothetical protein
MATPPVGLSTQSQAHEKAQVDVREEFRLAMVAPESVAAMFSTTEIADLAVQNNAGLSITGASVNSVDYSEAVMAYTDLFGNKYRVDYSDFARQMFMLVQPANLRPPANGIAT